MRDTYCAIAILALAVSLTVCIGMQGAEGKPVAQPGGMLQRISLDLENAPATDSLKALAKKAGINIVLSKSVTGQCTLQLRNVTIKEAFDSIITSNRLAYVVKDAAYHVMTGREYEDRYGKDFADARETKTFRLKYAIPERAFQMIQNLKSNIGNIVVDEESGTVLIVDTPERIREMEEVLAVLEKPNEVEVIQIKRAKAKQIETVMKPWLDDKKLGSIVADESGNQVLVQALPGRMKEVRVLIEKLDKEAVVEAEPTFLGTTARLLAVVLLALAVLVFLAAVMKVRRARAGL